MKKLIPILLIITMLVSLVACNPSSSETSKNNSSPSSDSDTSGVTSLPDESKIDDTSKPVDESEPADESDPEDESEPEDESDPEVIILDYTDYFDGVTLYDISGNEEDRSSPFAFGGSWNIKRTEDGTYDFTVNITITCTTLKMGARTIYLTINGEEHKIQTKPVDVKRDSNAVKYLIVTLGQTQTKVELDEDGGFSADVSVKMVYNGTYSDVPIKTLEFNETISVNK